MAQVKFRTPEGDVKAFKLEDKRPFWVYDTITLTAATNYTESMFFQSPQGKTPLETNLTQFSTLPQGWTFLARKIRLGVNSDVSLANIEGLFSRNVITYLEEGINDIFTLPAYIIGAGGGISGITTATSADVLSHGLPTQASALKLPAPLPIVGGRTFQFRMKMGGTAGTGFTPATSDVRVNMTLEGILIKDVR